MPYPLLWLRYTTFIVLYPLGVASELAMVYLALPTIRKSKMWSAPMPNSLNIGFDYHLICWAMLAGYIPGETEGQAVNIDVSHQCETTLHAVLQASHSFTFT